MFFVAWHVHRLLGLIVGALLLLLSVTGGVLVLQHDWERALHPERHVVVPAPAQRSRLDAVRAVVPQAPPGYRLYRYKPGVDPADSDQLTLLASDGRTRWVAFLNPATGAVLWSGADQSIVSSWLLHLHMNLRAGATGYIITGIAGLALFLLGLSGLYIHRRPLHSLRRWPVRFDRGWSGAWTDLHRWLGVVSLYFSLALGATGAVYAFRSIPSARAVPPVARAPFDAAQLTPLEPVLARAQETFPGAEIYRLSFPRDARAPLSALVLERSAPVWRKFSRIDFNPRTGAVLAVRDARRATFSEKLSNVVAPLHFGSLGSPLTKWLYALGGFAPAVLAASGFVIWWRRRRQSSDLPR